MSRGIAGRYASAMSRILDLPVRCNHVPHDVFSILGFAGAEELANMFEVQCLYIPDTQRELKETLDMNPDTHCLLKAGYCRTGNFL